MTEKIAVALVSRVSAADLQRARAKPPAMLGAYELLLKGLDAYRTRYSNPDISAGLAEARRYFEQAIAAEPDYARAHAALADAYYSAFVEPNATTGPGSGHLKPEFLTRALQIAERAVTLDPSLVEARISVAKVLARLGRYTEALDEFMRAITINPNPTIDFRDYASALNRVGRAAEAQGVLERLIAHNPIYPANVDGALGHALFLQRKFSQALTPLDRCIRRAPNFRPCFVWQAAAMAHLGRTDEARAAAENVLKIEPKFRIGNWLDFVKYASSQDAQLLSEGLKRAGLPH